jgi:two-component system response regulator DesR
MTDVLRARYRTIEGPPRLVIADDNPDVLDELRDLLEPEFQIVGRARNGEELLDQVEKLRPDAVVTDVQMPCQTGIAAGKEIINRGLCDVIVALSVHNTSQFIRDAILAGMRGYVLKENAGEELIPALRKVLNGGHYLSSSGRLSKSGPDLSQS